MPIPFASGFSLVPEVPMHRYVVRYWGCPKLVGFFMSLGGSCGIWIFMQQISDQPATEQLPGLPASAFHKADIAPDAAFYAQPRLVGAYMQAAGFDGLNARAAVPPSGDPLWAVIGRAPGR
jgi:hypothetical protein